MAKPDKKKSALNWSIPDELKPHLDELTKLVPPNQKWLVVGAGILVLLNLRPETRRELILLTERANRDGSLKPLLTLAADEQLVLWTERLLQAKMGFVLDDIKSPSERANAAPTPGIPPVPQSQAGKRRKRRGRSKSPPPDDRS